MPLRSRHAVGGRGAGAAGGGSGAGAGGRGADAGGGDGAGIVMPPMLGSGDVASEPDPALLCPLRR